MSMKKPLTLVKGFFVWWTAIFVIVMCKVKSINWLFFSISYCKLWSQRCFKQSAMGYVNILWKNVLVKFDKHPSFKRVIKKQWGNNFFRGKKAVQWIIVLNLNSENKSEQKLLCSDMVWVRGFEPPASWTPFKHATKLRHTQMLLN